MCEGLSISSHLPLSTEINENTIASFLSSLEAPEQLSLPDALLMLHDHDCLLTTLSFLSWEDLNVFALTSRGCLQLRNHSSLDQTRSGTISIKRKGGVSNAMELMEKVRDMNWSDAFCGHRTHLRLCGLTHLSANIEPIDDDFINSLAPLKRVTSLDCSIRRENKRGWLSPFEDYIDKGFAQGLTLSLLVPNLREIVMNYLPLTLLGVAWIAENNPNLEVMRWNHSLIWPINNDACGHLKACKNLRELYLDETRMLFCTANLDQDRLWEALAINVTKLEKLSIRGARVYRKGHLSPLSQESLMKFVRAAPSLKWLRSGLSAKNIKVLKKERPDMVFCD